MLMKMRQNSLGVSISVRRGCVTHERAGIDS
jgi:hypothetical protein